MLLMPHTSPWLTPFPQSLAGSIGNFLLKDNLWPLEYAKLSLYIHMYFARPMFRAGHIHQGDNALGAVCNQ